MQNNLENKVIAVTGANGIIGLEVCRLALLQGAKIAAIDISDNNITALKENLPKEHVENLFYIQCDVRNRNALDHALSQIISRWAQLDGLHNNAAWKGKNLEDFFTPFEDYKLETWQEIFSVNLDSVMLVDQVFGSQMVKQKKGSIVHTASIYGLRAPDNRIYEGSEYMGTPINTPAVYAASKGGVIALSRYLAGYWGPKNIRVNTVTPGGVESGQNDIFTQNYSSKVPLGRMAKNNEIAEAVLFLLSDQSSYMTGHNLVVDGGYTQC